MLEFQKKSAVVFDHGNNLRQRAYDAGVKDAFNFSGFVPAYIRPLFCEGKGPFRWVALSGDPEDLYTTAEAILELFPEDEHLAPWIRLAREQVALLSVEPPGSRSTTVVGWLGYSIHAGQVIVADGTAEAVVRLERVLIADPWTAIIRHVDAGYKKAIEMAKGHGIKVPMMATDE